MPNLKASIKDVKRTAIRTNRNNIAKSILRTNIRKFENTLAEGSAEEAKIALFAACRTIDKSVTKGILHKNSAARRKSRLSKLYNRTQVAAVAE